MPIIPIIPHIKTKNKFEFSAAGFISARENAITVPMLNAVVDCVFHTFTLFPTKMIEAKISPKKNAHINTGWLSNKYSNKLAIVKTLTMLPEKTAVKK